MFNPVFDSIALATNRPVDQSARLLTPEEQSAALEAITADSAALLTPVQQSAGGQLGSWRPTDLTTDLLAWWDAEDLSAGAVSSWVDRVANRNAAQATPGNQPIKGTWGVAFDGTDDFLTLASQPFPSGNNPVEMWALVNQPVAGTVTGAKTIFSYGGSTNNDSRRIFRNPAGNINRAAVGSSTGAAQFNTTGTLVDFTGRHVVRGRVTTTGASLSVNGNALSAETSGTSAIGTVRARIGASTLNTAALFWQGDIAAVILTNLLSATNAASMAAYLMARR